MAQATYGVTTATTYNSTSNVNKTWKKIQGKVAQGMRFSCEEYDWFEEFSPENIDWSARETLISLELNEEIGVATLPEGGKLARPSSADLEEIAISLVQLNKRFTASSLAKWADKGMNNQVERQLKRQAKNAVFAMGRRFADAVYGTSVGTVALTDSDVANADTATLVLKDAYGKADIDDAAYIANLFRVGEWYALIDGSSLVANSFFRVTAIDPSVPDIDVAFVGNVTVSNNNLKIVYANNVENTTAAGGTDLDRGLTGFLDVCTTAALHGLTHDNWDVSFEDSTGGRLTPARLRKGKQMIDNLAPGAANRLVIAQGVERDLIDQERSLIRWSSPTGMELDGSVKMKNFEIVAPRRCPPKHAVMYRKSAYRKVALLPKPEGTDGLNWEDGYQMQDDDGMIFRTDMVIGLFTNSRRSFGYWDTLQEAA